MKSTGLEEHVMSTGIKALPREQKFVLKGEISYSFYV